MLAPLPLSARSHRTTDSPITYLIRQALETPGLISLAAGLVDEASLPVREVGEAVAALMADPARSRAALQYGSTAGLPALRQKVLDHITRLDGVRPDQLALTTDDVVLTTGSQQLLELVAEALFDPGDIVITEAPSYFVYHSLLQSHGVQVVTVPMDSGGLDLRALEKELATLERAGAINRLKLIYTVDYFQNPTGLSLSADRREALLEIVKRYSRRHRLLILEDAAYRELRLDGPDLPSIKRHDVENAYVIYAGTFSKPCAPGLKTGYALLPKDLVAPVLHLKGGHDFGSNNLALHILDELLANGSYERHAGELRAVYRSKRDTMLAALEEQFGDLAGVRWTRPSGGLYVWMSFPPSVETGPSGPLVSAALEEGVLYVPGEFCHVGSVENPAPRHELRLCYAVASRDEIVEGIRRLRRAARCLERPSPRSRCVAVPR